MRLFLLRHGDAPFDKTRGKRALSDQGVSQIRWVTQCHRADLQGLELILCSPVLRARQSLRVLTECLGYRGELIFEDVLRSESSVAAVERYVDRLQVESLLLLSHQPLIGNMLDYLADKSGLGWSMSTGTLACLDGVAFGRGAGELQWLTHPEDCN